MEELVNIYVMANGEKIKSRHGDAFDRGSADSWYRRNPQPHFYREGSYMSERVNQSEMTKEEIRLYNLGYEYNELQGGHKDYCLENSFE